MKVGAILRRWLLTGSILVAPVAITFFTVLWLFRLLDAPIGNMLLRLTGYHIPGVGLISLLCLVLLVGAIATTLAARVFIVWFENRLDRVPFVRTLYSGVKQLVAPLADHSRGTFQNVVIAEYPEGAYSLGFLIRRDLATSPTGEKLSAVLIPTNHLHLGNVALLPHSRIHVVDMSAEAGLKFLVSMGAALDKHLVIGNPPKDASSSS